MRSPEIRLIQQMIDDPDCFKKALERRTDQVRAERGLPHLHGEYVEGCFRCDLSREEVTNES